MTKTTTKTTRSRKPVYAGCGKAIHEHVRGGKPWTCRSCGKQACSRCAKYYWSAKEATRPGALSSWFHIEDHERVATCGSCRSRRR